jgi:hypothetical protein
MQKSDIIYNADRQRQQHGVDLTSKQTRRLTYTNRIPLHVVEKTLNYKNHSFVEYTVQAFNTCDTVSPPLIHDDVKLWHSVPTKPTYPNGTWYSLNTRIRETPGSNLVRPNSYYRTCAVVLSTCRVSTLRYATIASFLTLFFKSLTWISSDLVPYYTASALWALSVVNETTKLISVYSSPSSYKNNVVTSRCHLLIVITQYSCTHDMFITVFRRNPSDSFAVETPTRTDTSCTPSKTCNYLPTKHSEFQTQNAYIYNTACSRGVSLCARNENLQKKIALEFIS